MVFLSSPLRPTFDVQDTMFHIELGQDIGRTNDVLHVTTDGRKTWTPLHMFAYVSKKTRKTERKR